MPIFYGKPPKKSNKLRAQFAEAAVREAFRGRDLSLAREPDFIDRAPPHWEAAPLNKGLNANA